METNKTGKLYFTGRWLARSSAREIAEELAKAGAPIDLNRWPMHEGICPGYYLETTENVGGVEYTWGPVKFNPDPLRGEPRLKPVFETLEDLERAEKKIPQAPDILETVILGEGAAFLDRAALEADALVTVSGGWDAPTSGDILENLEAWKNRIKEDKGYLIDPKWILPQTVPPFKIEDPRGRMVTTEEEEKPKGQTRRGSLQESLVNIAVGYSINYVANLLIFPHFGWHISTRENLALGVIYTAISLARSYALRRFFNWRTISK